MKHHFRILLIAVIFSSCGSPKQDLNVESDTAKAPEAAVVTPSQNVLTEAEKSEGWKLLFDGNTMNGWRTFKNLENDSWEVIDGTLHCKPFKEDGTNKRADILTVDQFDNFEFAFEWKVAPQANTGVIYRATEENKEPYESGPEFQLIDDKGYPGDLQKWQLTGACYDMSVPEAEVKINPPGEWNTARLIAKNNHIEHWVNEVKVVEYEILSDEWKKRKSQGKWKDLAAYGIAKKGHIDLQDHKNECWFRNLKIKSL